MKKIILQRLELTNFKGCKSLVMDFNEKVTEIYGDNETGKTTLFDAFTWLLFGKDHTDSASFNIKTLDSENNAIHKLNHEVEAILYVDGVRVILKRLYKEKWVKQKGAEEAVLDGHMTTYFCDDVPVTATEFSKKINELINEDLFKLITNPLYFNGLAWLKRRTILEQIANKISDNEIAGNNEEFIKLLVEMGGKSYSDFKKIIAAAKKKIKAELDGIPTRINEVTNSIPELEDFDSLKLELKAKNEEVENVLSQIIDSSKLDEGSEIKIREKQNELNSLNSELANLQIDEGRKSKSAQNEYQNNVSDANRKVQFLEQDISKLENLIEKEVSERQTIEVALVKLRADFDAKHLTKIELNQNDFACPTCKRDFEEFKIEEMKAEAISNFNSKKAEEIESIRAKGKSLAATIEKIKTSIEKFQSEKDAAQKELEIAREEYFKVVEKKPEVVNDAAESIEVTELKVKIEKATNDVSELKNASKKTDQELINSLEEKRKNLKFDIDIIQKKINKEEQIEYAKKRIAELEKSNKLYSSELAKLEKEEFVLERFNSEKMNKIEESINSMFPTVRFKLFSQQLNGGVSECCETLINGVPFDNANNAAKIQAGIEIINVLCLYYSHTAPIFVDNAESITKIPYSESQMIRLVVSEFHSSLTIK